MLRRPLFNIWINYLESELAAQHKTLDCLVHLYGKTAFFFYSGLLTAFVNTSLRVDYVFFKMGANNGKQYGSEGKGSSSISSDISSSTDHTPTKAPKNVATTEGLDSSTRTLSTPSPGLILPSKSSSLSSPALSSNGHETNSSSSSSAPAETVAVVHSQPGTHTRSRQSKSHHHAPIDLLPDHSLLQIFSHLPTNQLCRCARVCRRWYNLAWDPRLWSTVRLTGELLHADRAIRVLTHRLCQDTPNVCLTLETVVVNGCKRLTDRGLHVVAQSCPELRHLEVAGCYNISNDAVFEVVSRCPNLEHLNLSGCSKVTCISLTQEASLQLSPLHGQQISIHYLDMTDCFSLEDEGLRTIAAHCPRLTHLYLRRCIRLTDEAMRHLALHCPSIRELSLSDCRLVGDFGLREVARLEGCLRYLSVAHCTRITDVGMRYVARYCPRLRYLNARGCEGLTDHGLGHLARSCPKLKSLDVGKCPLVSDSGLEQLAMYCQGLRRVSLRACESVTGRGLKALAANCCELQLLNVQDCEVSPEALRFVRRHCRRCVIEHTNPAFY
ncbi:F-box/LRR-repeat protein 7 [Scomber scombrus]|nr:F-box/LRR-repeat protein 7 [Scomber scombrus]